MTLLSFPTNDEWNMLYDSSPFERIYLLLESFDSKIRGSQQTSNFMDASGVIGYVDDLYLRLSYTAKSYLLSKFYFDKGIPDEPAHETRNYGKVWYPNFKDDDWFIKGWFDFSSSSFYFHLFSSWDTLGHILNDWYRLGLESKKVYFDAAVAKLEMVERPLYEKMKELTGSDVYKDAKKIRNDITHNYLPNMPGMKVFRPKHHSLESMVEDLRVLGVKDPVSSKKITVNSLELLELFAKSVAFISDSWK